MEEKEIAGRVSIVSRVFAGMVALVVTVVVLAFLTTLDRILPAILINNFPSLFLEDASRKVGWIAGINGTLMLVLTFYVPVKVYRVVIRKQLKEDQRNAVE